MSSIGRTARGIARRSSVAATTGRWPRPRGPSAPAEHGRRTAHPVADDDAETVGTAPRAAVDPTPGRRCSGGVVPGRAEPVSSSRRRRRSRPCAPTPARRRAHPGEGPAPAGGSRRWRGFEPDVGRAPRDGRRTRDTRVLTTGGTAGGDHTGREGHLPQRGDARAPGAAHVVSPARTGGGTRGGSVPAPRPARGGAHRRACSRGGEECRARSPPLPRLAAGLPGEARRSRRISATRTRWPSPARTGARPPGLERPRERKITTAASDLVVARVGLGPARRMPSFDELVGRACSRMPVRQRQSEVAPGGFTRGVAEHDRWRVVTPSVSGSPPADPGRGRILGLAAEGSPRPARRDVAIDRPARRAAPGRRRGGLRADPLLAPDALHQPQQPQGPRSSASTIWRRSAAASRSVSVRTRPWDRGGAARRNRRDDRLPDPPVLGRPGSGPAR